MVRFRFGLALLAVVGLLGASAPGALAGATSRRAAGAASGGYVALGDSYAAGPLIPNQDNLACARSDANYPSLVAASLHPASFTDASCSGATTADMARSQPDVPGPPPPQLDALTAKTTLVTLTIGGNDIGFAAIGGTCALLSLLDPIGAPCEAHYTSGGTDQLRAAIAATAPSVASVLAAIHRRSPKATVLVVGYPDLLPATGPGCWPLVPLADGDVPYLNGIEQALNAMLASEAAAHRATYVDTYTPSIGHDMCQLLGPKWVEGFLPTLPAAPLHPNEYGMQATAADVLAALYRSAASTSRAGHAG
ncbi:MAG TPA: SGNH/GDSL hydrolase family protein [Actinomycetota bacterium]|nr:SGNH/GDSL hydrolase family protein [Actinomycetota bacterium]